MSGNTTDGTVGTGITLSNEPKMVYVDALKIESQFDSPSISDNGITAAFNNKVTVAADIEITGDNLFIQNNSVEYRDVRSVVDDGLVTLLSSAKEAYGHVWGGGEYMQFYFDGNITVTKIGTSYSTNTAITDSDGNFCVYWTGTVLTLKNRLGSSKTSGWYIQYGK